MRSGKRGSYVRRNIQYGEGMIWYTCLLNYMGGFDISPWNMEKNAEKLATCTEINSMNAE